MTRTERLKRLKDVEDFLFKCLKYDHSNFIFTQHLALLFCKEKYPVNKDRFVQDCCLILRDQKEKFGIPSLVEIRSSYCPEVSPRLFQEDNGFSNKCLYHFTWKDPDKDQLCQDGPRFLQQYLELREQKRSKTKSAYFEPEFSYEDFKTEEGCDKIATFIKNVGADPNLNLNHNRNIMFMQTGNFFLLRKLTREIKQLKDQEYVKLKKK